MSDQSTLLLIEDNDLDAERVLRSLKRLEIDRPLVRARDGGEGLEILRANAEKTVDRRSFIVMLDLNMPRVNGLEFLEALREEEPIAQTPVIVLTTSEMQSDIDAAYEHNVAGFMVKPLRGEDLENLLRAANDYWDISELPATRRG